MFRNAPSTPNTPSEPYYAAIFGDAPPPPAPTDLPLPLNVPRSVLLDAMSSRSPKTTAQDMLAEAALAPMTCTIRTTRGETRTVSGFPGGNQTTRFGKRFYAKESRAEDPDEALKSLATRAIK
jgi:hypothetical protein